MTQAQVSETNMHPEFHVVEINESLADIARLYGFSPKQLQTWNQLSESALIFPGMKINLKPVPGVSTETSLLTVIPTAAAIETVSPKACLVHGFHRIKQGESISKIAAVYGIPTHQLLEQNNLNWNSPIFIGQKILLPGVHEMHNCPDFKPLQRSYRDVARKIVSLGLQKPVPEERIAAALSRIYELHALPEANHEHDFELLFESTENAEYLVSAWVWLAQIKVELPGA
jgi:LysM repeat protein